MSESVIDFASLDADVTTSDAPIVDTPVVDAPAVDTDAPVADADASKDVNTDGAKKDAKPQFNSDGTPKEEPVVEKKDDLPGTEKTPQEIRSLLKSMRDADPKNVAAVKQLHGAYERWEAAKTLYPGGIKEMTAAKEFMGLVGGHEGLEKLQNTSAAAEASDNQLYEGSPELISNIVDDLKAHNKLDALGKLAPAFFDAVKANDEKGYYSAFAPHFIAGLELVNMPGAINGLVSALNNPALKDADPAKAAAAATSVIAKAAEIAGGLKEWYSGLDAENKKAKEAVVSPERQQLDKDRAVFLKQQEEFKTTQSTQFKNSVASANEKDNNRLLGTELAPFLKMPFFKGYGKENLMPLGNTIKSNLYTALKADTTYQAQMKAMWGAKTPDRAKIEEYHKARVASIAKDIVRDTVQRMYPGYAKGGAAAGRVAATAEKKEAVTKADAAAAATGKPVYVATKPAWDAIDWDKDPKQLLYITGKAYLKAGGKLVTWRKA
jgi:hypothetical protein